MKFKLLYLVAICLLLSTGAIFGKGPQFTPLELENCQSQVPYGKPHALNKHGPVICRHAYLLQHDNEAKIPVWVAYVLTPEHTIGCVVRSNSFAPDLSLPPGERAELKDYRKSGYDIGHQANDADMSWDRTVEQESFILSNMAPQLPGFNRGIWKELETNVRVQAFISKHPLLIYVGPIYDVTKDAKIGPGEVDVPSKFYKIIVDLEKKKSWAYIFSHQEGLGKDLAPFQTTVADVIAQANITFPVPDDTHVKNDSWLSGKIGTKDFTQEKGTECHR